MMDEKLRRVRYFCNYCIVLIFIWVPMGLLLTFDRMLVDPIWLDHYEEPSTAMYLRDILIRGGFVLYYVYIAFGPMLAMWVVDPLLKEKLLDLFRVRVAILPRTREDVVENVSIRG